MKKRLPILIIGLSLCLNAEEPAIFEKNLILDLNAAKGVTINSQNRVTTWQSQAKITPTITFLAQNKGRKEPGSGQPTFRPTATINQKPSIVFLQQELVCQEEDYFDSLITGDGYTWIAIIAVHEQRIGLKNVNSFFGNLRNGGFYEGMWGCVNDDNSIWIGSRNGKSFGRFDANNPQLLGPILSQKKFHIVAGTMAAGTNEAKLSLYVNSPTPCKEATFPINPKANPSRMVIGQERDAIEHPGHESFDGEIARFLLWRGPLSDDQWQQTFTNLTKTYQIALE